MPGAEEQRTGQLEHRLAELSRAGLQINESLHLETVLEEVLQNACALTGARWGVMSSIDQTGQFDDLRATGVSAARLDELKTMNDQLLDYLGGLREPLRGDDLVEHCRALGLPEFSPPVAACAFLFTPLRHRGEAIGTIYLAKDEAGGSFSSEDEQSLITFASLAALVIVNARQHHRERQARADLETLVEMSPVGVLVFEARSGAIVSLNREMKRIMAELGMKGGEQPTLFLERLMSRRADGREVSLAQLPLVQSLGSGEVVRVEQIEIRSAEGRSVTLLVDGQPIRADSGEIETVVVTAQDLAPLHERERQRTDFLGMVSHELGEPLTSIKGAAVSLRESLDSLGPAELGQLVQIIEMQSDRMRRLIAELLDAARIESGTLSVNPQPVAVGAVVDEARRSFLIGGGREFVVDLDPNLPLVMADRQRIVQVLGNLLGNADKFSRVNAPIHLSAALAGGFVRFTVTDQGFGITAEQLPLLFLKFSRVVGAETGPETTGSGLGLAICKGIVEAHGGRIWAESEGPGQGSRFSFSLPAMEGSAPVTRQHAAELPDESDILGRILIVDDDPMTLRYVREILAEAGYMPLVTSDPEQALRMFEIERPDVTLLDLVLPDCDGIELMGEMRAIADAPVMFFSAYRRDEVIAKALDAGAADYVLKPFSKTELLARLRLALRQAATPKRPDEPFALGALTLDERSRAVRLDGRTLELTPTEYSLLVELSRNAGRVVTHEQLLRRVWRRRPEATRRVVRTYVKRLRRKLGDQAANPTYIIAVPRVGYRLGPSDAGRER